MRISENNVLFLDAKKNILGIRTHSGEKRKKLLFAGIRIWIRMVLAGTYEAGQVGNELRGNKKSIIWSSFSRWSQAYSWSSGFQFLLIQQVLHDHEDGNIMVAEEKSVGAYCRPIPQVLWRWMSPLFTNDKFPLKCWTLLQSFHAGIVKMIFGFFYKP